MIYLIDDNHNDQRLNFYNIHFVEEGIFRRYLTSIERLEKHETTDISHLAFLNDAKCILLHITTEDWDKEKGFLKGSTTNVKKIWEEIADHGDKIPLVLFSNDMSEQPIYAYKENPNLIRGIKKNIFYKHLYDFVEHYKNTNEIELRMLAWGKNFQAEEVTYLTNNLLKTVALLHETNIFKINQLSDKQQDFNTLMEKSCIDANYLDILKDLENHPISVGELRKKVNLISESFLKYGKNIYPW